MSNTDILQPLFALAFWTSLVEASNVVPVALWVLAGFKIFAQ